MEKTLNQQLDEAEQFAKKHIVELAKLILEWKNTGLLGNGSHCLVHDLADMFPKTGKSIPLAESIINSICLEMVSNSSQIVNAGVSQEEFNKSFNDILEGSTQRYLDPKTEKVSKRKTTHIEILNKNGEWLIDYDSNPKDPHFWYQYDRVYLIFHNKLSLKDEEIQLLMKSLMETQYKMKDVTPYKAYGWIL